MRGTALRDQEPLEAVAEGLARQLLGDVEGQALARVVHELERAAQRARVAAGRVGRQLDLAIDVGGQIGCVKGDAEQVAVPQADQRELQVERLSVDAARESPRAER